MMGNAAKPKVAVIGGGLAGLECALRLLRHGVNVQIIEVGGQSRTRHVDMDRKTHAGDDKVRYWSSENWGQGGGLPCRFGGRSLCYHGVMLEIPASALVDWGDTWAGRLKGENGLYRSVVADLQASYPEISNERSEHSHVFPLRHVPQAARIDSLLNFEAYSPIPQLVTFRASEQLQITRARAQALVRQMDGRWEVQATSDHQQQPLPEIFDRCVLATSAIENVRLMSASLRRDLETQITDHFCVGLLLRIKNGLALPGFKHRKLWSGYIPLPHLATNLFVSERKAFENGDRLIELTGVIEQSFGSGSFSSLTTGLGHDGNYHSHIDGRISEQDEHLIGAVRSELQSWAEVIAGHKMAAAPPASSLAGNDFGSSATDTPSTSVSQAAASLAVAERAGLFSEYSLPYGAFEHEACSHPIGAKLGAVGLSDDLELEDMPGVYAIGPGSFPRLSEANPALTILATSRWAADTIAAGLL